MSVERLVDAIFSTKASGGFLGGQILLGVEPAHRLGELMELVGEVKHLDCGVLPVELDDVGQSPGTAVRSGVEVVRQVRSEFGQQNDHFRVPHLLHSSKLRRLDDGRSCGGHRLGGGPHDGVGLDRLAEERGGEADSCPIEAVVVDEQAVVGRSSLVCVGRCGVPRI